MARRYAEETYEHIMNEMISHVSDTLDKREGSIIFDALAPAAKKLEQAYIELDKTLDRAFVDTATGDDLELRTKEQGVERKPALKTVRFLQCLGSGGRIFTGDRFLIGDIYFRSVQDLTLPGVLKIESELVGGQTVPDLNDAVLSVQGIPGLERAFLVPNNEDFNGVDAESDDDLRNRYYATVRRNAGSGNISDYVFWCSEVPGAGRVIVEPLWNGRGTVRLILLDSDGNPASPGLITDVKEYIDPIDGEGMGRAPIGASVTVVSASPLAVNVTATLELDGSRLVTDILPDFISALSDYFRKLTLSKATELVYNKVGAMLLGVNGLMDYSNLTINGLSTNVAIATSEIPVVGTVILRDD